jgi:hypothetical protein
VGTWKDGRERGREGERQNIQVTGRWALTRWGQGEEASLPHCWADLVTCRVAFQTQASLVTLLREGGSSLASASEGVVAGVTHAVCTSRSQERKKACLQVLVEQPYFCFQGVSSQSMLMSHLLLLIIHIIFFSEHRVLKKWIVFLQKVKICLIFSYNNTSLVAEH